MPARLMPTRLRNREAQMKRRQVGVLEGGVVVSYPVLEAAREKGRKVH